MPAGVADFGSETWLEMVFGITPLATNYYIALLSDEASEGMDGDMISDLEPWALDPTYARQTYGVGSSNWATNDGFITNINEIDFPIPQADWEYITHFAIVDAPTSGNLFAWGEFLNPQYVSSSVQMIIPAGGIVITLFPLDNSIAV